MWQLTPLYQQKLLFHWNIRNKNVILNRFLKRREILWFFFFWSPFFFSTHLLQNIVIKFRMQCVTGKIRYSLYSAPAKRSYDYYIFLNDPHTMFLRKLRCSFVGRTVSLLQNNNDSVDLTPGCCLQIDNEITFGWLMNRSYFSLSNAFKFYRKKISNLFFKFNIMTFVPGKQMYGIRMLWIK